MDYGKFEKAKFIDKQYADVTTAIERLNTPTIEGFVISLGAFYGTIIVGNVAGVEGMDIIADCQKKILALLETKKKELSNQFDAV